jgi:hypothetical protein
MQYFYIKQGSTLPTLRMELIEDGRHDYNKFHELIQNSSITFSMVNRETGVTKVAKMPAYIKAREDGGCVEQYVICYDWRKHDTKEEGNYIGTFDIEFGEVKNDDYTYPKGNLIMPIREDLLIIIK